MMRQKDLTLCFGEVLWDMLPGGKKIGGAPLNAAYHLGKLGVPVALVSRVGQDAYGAEIRDFVEKAGLRELILQTDTSHPTSRVEVVISPDGEVRYDILPGVAWDHIGYDAAVAGLAARATYLVFGSLAARSQTSEGTLEKLLDEIPVKVLDVNLREPFYTRERLLGLLQKADILKMNKHELDIISGWLGDQGNGPKQMEALYRKLHPKVLIVTCGSKGAYLLAKNKRCFHPGFKTKVADTVGSGDAFLAGFLSEYIKGSPLDQALDTANKMGAFTAGKSGGCPDYDKTELLAGHYIPANL